MAGNAIAERMQGGQAAPEPEDMMEQWAQEAGVPPGTSPEEAMRMIWAKMPTDHVGEVIDMLSQKYGVPPPWAGQPGTKMKLGGPSPEAEAPMREAPMGNAISNQRAY